MNEAFLLAIVSATWAGILTSVSPCPLATNVAAVSFIAQGAQSRRMALLTGALYALGRALAYVALAVLLVRSLLSAPEVSAALQRHMTRVMGPVLVLVGMVLLELLPLPSFGGRLGAKIGPAAAKHGAWGAFGLGAVFALSFCPASAALYFGTLLPLSLETGSAVLLPTLYGLGTALPVLVFAFAIAAGAQRVAALFDRVRDVERWARGGTGVLFILIGVGMTLIYVFDVF